MFARHQEALEEKTGDVQQPPVRDARAVLLRHSGKALEVFRFSLEPLFLGVVHVAHRFDGHCSRRRRRGGGGGGVVDHLQRSELVRKVLVVVVFFLVSVAPREDLSPSPRQRVGDGRCSKDAEANVEADVREQHEPMNYARAGCSNGCAHFRKQEHGQQEVRQQACDRFPVGAVENLPPAHEPAHRRDQRNAAHRLRCRHQRLQHRLRLHHALTSFTSK
mmetsp:Transcript_3881/g.12036  ORF Transcript_3881/g.12036 Transcript_3881/m.12036 type:complete len:219 (-) Transcript_3881:22-678(-)